MSEFRLGLITARGGSKGLPRKNILPFGGKPLIAWTIEAAQQSGVVDRLIVSTDDEEIAAVARGCGAEVPFLRPAALATDEVGSFEVASHALAWMAEREDLRPDWLVLLQPTSPLRRSSDIEASYDQLRQAGADAIIGVCEPATHPYLARTITTDGRLDWLVPAAAGIKRRQDYPEAFVINGAIYIIRGEALLESRTFQPPHTVPYVMPRERSVDIDNQLDFDLAELLLQQNLRHECP